MQSTTPRRRAGVAAKSRRNALRTLRKRDSFGLLLLGKNRVGKSALVSRWIQGTFDEQYSPTVEDFHLKQCHRYMGQTVNIGIIDMTGSWDFPAMLDLYLAKTDSVVLLYDVTDDDSIRQMSLFYRRLQKIRGDAPDVHLSIVGTKMDKQPHLCDSQANDAVEAFLGQLEMPDVKHTLTSAKLDLNVVEAFENAINDVIANMAPNAAAIKRLDQLMKEREKESLCKGCRIC